MSQICIKCKKIVKNCEFFENNKCSVGGPNKLWTLNGLVTCLYFSSY